VEIFGMTSTLLLTPFVITVVAKSSGKIFKKSDTKPVPAVAK
jgi:hypothetical protein